MAVLVFLIINITNAYALETKCADFIDNDDDDLTDAEDPDCECIYIARIEDRCYVYHNTVLPEGTYNLPEGIMMVADNVILDCNNATIKSDDVVVTIKGANSVVTNCQLEASEAGIGIQARCGPRQCSYGNTIKNNKITAPSGTGIDFFGAVNGNTIKNNKISDTETAIDIWGGNYKIENNFIDNTEKGIYVSWDNHKIENNFIKCSNPACIYGGTKNSKIIGNTIISNTQGINLQGEGILIQDNDIQSFSNGIVISSGEPQANNKIINNNLKGIYPNIGNGITLVGSSFSIIKNNNIERCGYGIMLVQSSNNLVSYNIMRFNGVGIGISSDDNKISYNIACENQLVDFSGIGGGTNTGIDNTCDVVWDWNDEGVKGCTFPCSNVTVFLSQLRATEEEIIEIKNIPNEIWPGSYPIADSISSSFTIEAIIDAYPEKPPWTPKCKYTWEILNTNKKDSGEFIGWSGMFSVSVPEKVGKYILKLNFEIYDNKNVVVDYKMMNHDLYVTYDEPCEPVKPPKEIWLDYACTWASGATTPEEVVSKLKDGIYYESNWIYRDVDTDWDVLVEGDASKGNCVSFSNIWVNLAKILGIDNVETERKYGLRYGIESFLGFVTKPTVALDDQDGNAHNAEKRWVFSMHQVGVHQVGEDENFYDPTFGEEYDTINDFIEWYPTGNTGEDAEGNFYWEVNSHKVYPKDVSSPSKPWGEFEYHSNHKSNKLDSMGAKFTGYYFDYGIDTDDDGLYNHLVTEIEINITKAGDYGIFGLLKFEETYITPRSHVNSAGFSDYYLYSDEGVKNITLHFSGEDIYVYKVDGNYSIELILLDENGVLIDYEIFNISFYDHTLFGELPRIVRYNLSLKEGWNLISIPLNLTNKLIKDVFNDINFKSIFSYGSWHYYFNETNNNFNSINESKGYWVNSLENQTLVIKGTEFSYINISLEEGWNLIGYHYLNETDINNSDLKNYPIFSYTNNSWLSHNPNRINSLNTLKTLKPAHGYWVKVK